MNLIGEHVDYCGYSVCPMAIEQDVLLAVAENDDDDHDNTLRLTNVDSRYQDYQHQRLDHVRLVCLDYFYLIISVSFRDDYFYSIIHMTF